MLTCVASSTKISSLSVRTSLLLLLRAWPAAMASCTPFGSSTRAKLFAPSADPSGMMLVNAALQRPSTSRACSAAAASFVLEVVLLELDIGN